MESPGEFPGALGSAVIWALFGLFVGSFLNVAIHRLPREGESVNHPRRSRCPSCGHPIAWHDNLPLISWLVLRGRCRACRWPIPWRYPLVELLTALLWGFAAYREPSFALALTQNVVLAGLVVATFVDFDFFEIPDEVSIGGIVLAPIASLALPELHRATWLAHELSSGAEVDRTGALLASLAGILVGAGVLLAIGAVGKRLYGRDAMGLGDVKLLAAGGGFVGPGGALTALLIASLIASVVGVLNMGRFFVLVRHRARTRGVEKSFGKALRTARIAGRYLPFGPYLGIGIGIVLLGWNDVARLMANVAF